VAAPHSTLEPVRERSVAPLGGTPVAMRIDDMISCAVVCLPSITTGDGGAESSSA